MTDTFVTVGTYWDVLEANLAKARLEQEGIATLLEDENVAALNYWAASPRGAKLRVKEADAERARQILDAVTGSEDSAADASEED